MLEKDDLDLVCWKKIKNGVPSALWSINESSKNPFTMYNNNNFRELSKIVFPYDLWCFHVCSQTPVMTPKLSRIRCFPGITQQLP